MTQTAIESSRMVDYRPISTLTSEGPIEFVIPGDTSEYIDPSHLYLYVKCKVVRANGDNLQVAAAGPPPVAADIVGPVNNFLHAMFSQVDVYLNDKIVSSSNGTYPYRSYFETSLNYGEDATNTHLKTGLWYKDTAGQFNTLTNDNVEFQKRSAMIAGSASIEMFGRVYTDITTLNRILPNKVNMRVKLSRSKDAFCLMAGQQSDFKVHLEEVILYARRLEISADVSLQLNQYMLQDTAKLPLTRVETRVHTIPQNVSSFNLDNLFLGKVPKGLVIGFVSNTAFNGQYNENPFQFQHFNLNKLQVQVGSKFYPPTPLTPDFANNLFIPSYHTLISGTGVFHQNAGHTISPEEYPNGYTLYAFILSPTNTLDDSTWDVVKDSPLNIKMGFSQNLQHSITCVVYAQFDSLIQIDKDRNVYTDNMV